MGRTVLVLIGLSTMALAACGAGAASDAAGSQRGAPAAQDSTPTAPTSGPTSIVATAPAPATVGGAAVPADSAGASPTAAVTDEELAQAAAEIDALDQELAGLAPNALTEDNA